MGTNYYVKEKLCEHCNRYEEVHIGKKSYGWSFCFNPKFNTFKQWKEYLNANKDLIYNEYGDHVLLEELLQLIESSKNESNCHEDIIDPEGYRFSKYDDFC